VGPEIAAAAAFVYFTSRIAIAAVWAYHGIVPKLLHPETGEAALLTASGAFSASNAAAALPLIGMAEIAFAAFVVIAWRSTAPLWINAALNVVLVLAIAVTTPAALSAPFQPLTLGVALVTLSAIGIRVAAFVPSAARCRRRPR
jgi:hypothetical protein